MVVVRAALLWMLALGFFAPAWANTMPRGAIVDLVAGLLSTHRQLGVQPPLVLFHTPRIGQQNYLAAQTKAECEQRSTAMLVAERPCQVIQALSRLESSPHSRVRVDEVLRGWLILVASVASVILLALMVFINDARITAWIARQEDLTKSSADGERLATHPSGTGQP